MEIFPRNWPFVRKSTGHRWIPLTKTLTRSFNVFFDLHLNKRLSEQSRRLWFETPSGLSWRHCNAMKISRKTPHSTLVKTWYGSSLMSVMCERSFAIAIIVLCAISNFIWPRYIKSLLYMYMYYFIMCISQCQPLTDAPYLPKLFRLLHWHWGSRIIAPVPIKHRKNLDTWWRHQIGTLSALLALCAGNSPVTGEFPAQRPVTWSFGVFFVLFMFRRWRHNWLRKALRDVTIVTRAHKIMISISSDISFMHSLIHGRSCKKIVLTKTIFWVNILCYSSSFRCSMLSSLTVFRESYVYVSRNCQAFKLDKQPG